MTRSITETILLLSHLVTVMMGPSASDAFPEFRDRIPNGRSVPNPGIPGSVWAGVGHEAVGGGGARNPFGLDFAQAGFQWTKELCEMDSDGDGRSNGQELGDPDCEWEQADPEVPPATAARSHPGVPDEASEDPPPNYSATCADYDPPSDTIALDVAFTSPNMLDGSNRTEYVCEQYKVPPPDASDAYYHMIKTEILMNDGNGTSGDDGSSVLHHILVYMCDGLASTDGDRVGQGSYKCSGMENNCFLVAGWALGQPPICEPPNVGSAIAFGTGGQDAVFKIEAHYDNPRLVPASDQSGMRLHLTRELRPLESGMVILGMDMTDRQFTLEAGRSALVTRRNICPAAATQRAFNDRPIWIYAWNPHMHMLGRGLKTEHYRCGEKIGEISNIENFEFDNQQSYVLNPPIKVLPGDSLVTTCFFNTSEVSEPVAGGEETTNEMCDNYLSYYPGAYSEDEPGLFGVCLTFEEGISPEYVDFDDTTPFVLLDFSGDVILEDFESDPATNIGDCCAAASCEELYLSAVGDPCGVDSDCLGDAVCDGGLCVGGATDGGGDPVFPPTDSDDSSGASSSMMAPTGHLAWNRSGGAFLIGSLMVGLTKFG